MEVLVVLVATVVSEAQVDLVEADRQARMVLHPSHLVVTEHQPVVLVEVDQEVTVVLVVVDQADLEDQNQQAVIYRHQQVTEHQLLPQDHLINTVHHH